MFVSTRFTGYGQVSDISCLEQTYTTLEIKTKTQKYATVWDERQGTSHRLGEHIWYVRESPEASFIVAQFSQHNFESLL
jgi:hypothetical protein